MAKGLGDLDRKLIHHLQAGGYQPGRDDRGDGITRSFHRIESCQYDAREFRARQ